MNSSVFGVLNSAVKRLFKAKQRLMALFLVAIIVFGLSTQTVAALGIGNTSNPSPTAVASNSQAKLHQTSTTPSIGKINESSPPAPSMGTSSFAAAADANTPANGKGGTLLNSLHSALNSPAMTAPDAGPKTYTPHELTNQRTATSSTYLNANGSYTKTDYLSPHFYQNNGSWDTIDTTLQP